MTKTKALTLFLALFAVAMILPTAALADTVSIGFSCGAPGANPITTLVSGTSPQVVGPTTLNCTASSNGSFMTTVISGSGTPPNPQPNLLSDTIQTSATAPGTVSIFITESGITSITGINQFLSQFTTNQLGLGSTVTESTFVDTGNGIFALTSPLSTSGATSAALSSQPFLALSPSLTSPFSETAVFTLHAATPLVGFNDTINLTLPEPASLSMVGFGLLGLGTALRKKLSKI